MILTPSYHNSTVNPIIIGDSKSSLYVPILAMYYGNIVKSDDKSIVIYNLPFIHMNSYNNEENKVHRCNNFNDLFTTNTIISIKIYDIIYHIGSNIVYTFDENNELVILFLLATTYNSFLDSRKTKRINKEELILIRNRQALNVPKYNSMKRRFTNMYKVNFETVDVLETDNIINLCFKNTLKDITFEDLDDYNNFIKTINNE